MRLSLSTAIEAIITVEAADKFHRVEHSPFFNTVLHLFKNFSVVESGLSNGIINQRKRGFSRLNFEQR